MILPTEIKDKSQSGQILVIFLLVLVVGLALVLSIASRTVTDVRQSTTSDESNRAYFAAESGVQNALKKITENPSFTTTTSPGAADVKFSTVNNSSAAVGVTALQPETADTAFEFPGKIAKDDVAQVSLINNFTDLTTAGNTALTPPSVAQDWYIEISWGDSTFTSLTGPALEVSVISCSDPCTRTPTFEIKKMAFDPNSSRATATNFCLASTGPFTIAETTEGSARSFQFKKTFQLRPNTGCPWNDVVTPNFNPVMLRIRPLYNGPTSLAIRVRDTTPANRQLPKQGSKVVSIGTTPSGVTRKLTATRLYPALPAIFDYVLFNGGSLPLTK